MTAVPKGAARREILGRYGVRAPCQYRSARGSRHGDRKNAPDQLAADLVEDLSVAWSGVANVQAFRDLGGGVKLLGLAEVFHCSVDVSPVDSTSGQLSREGARAAHRPAAAHERARECLVVEVAELLEAP